jgi:DNA-binding MarR family transcriptional regulator
LLTSAGVTLRVDRVVKMGMVKRVDDLDDRRSVYVQLTDEGVDVVSRVALLNRERQRRMLDSLTPEESAVLESVFRKLEQSLVIPGWPDQ